MWSSFLLPTLLVFSELQGSAAVFARGQSNLRTAARSEHGGCGAHGCERASRNNATAASDPNFEILEETHLEKAEGSDCICPLGKFWHWRIKQCIDQGAWGYECGFYPKEHFHRVCADGLKCEERKAPGGYQQFKGARPATCLACQPEDKCKTGMERHKADCLIEYTLEGLACSKVKVVTKGTATAEASASHTVEKTVKKTAEVAKTAEAEHTAEASADAKKKVTVTEEATATVDGIAMETEKVKAKEDGASAEASSTATATAQATESKEATATGTGEGSATVKATKKESVTAKATSEQESTAKATRESTQIVEAEAEGIGEAKKCLDLNEVKKLLGLSATGKFGAVIAAKIIAKGDEVAFDRAYIAAIRSAEKNGLISAQEAAEKLAQKKADEDAKMAAEAAAEEKAAWKAEAKANDVAGDKAQKKAEKKAKVKAKTSATDAANAKAEKAAKAKAKGRAEGAASDAAEAQAQDEASSAAAAKANEKAEDKASAKAEAEAQGSADAKAEKAADAKADAEAEDARAEAMQNVADASNPPPQDEGVKKPRSQNEEDTLPKNMDEGDVAASLP